MKTLLFTTALILSLSASAQTFYQFNRFTTNLDTTLINGGNLTNLPSGSGFNPAVTITNFISGFIYLNTNTAPIYVSTVATLHIVGASGTAQVKLSCPSSGSDVSFFGEVAVAGHLTDEYGTLSGWIQSGETYTFTNTSSGSHTINLNPGSGRILSLK